MKSSLWSRRFSRQVWPVCHDTKYGYETAVDERFQLETSQSAMAQGRDTRNANWRVLGGHFCATHADHEIVCSIPLGSSCSRAAAAGLEVRKMRHEVSTKSPFFSLLCCCVAGLLEFSLKWMSWTECFGGFSFFFQTAFVFFLYIVIRVFWVAI